jgi:hypothetical protein
VIRNNLYDVFQLFDFSEPSVLNGDRDTTTVAPQALFMMNSELAWQAAQGLASRCLETSSAGEGTAAAAEPAADVAGQVRQLYEVAYGRPPSDEEVQRSQTFLSRCEQSLAAAQPDAARRRQQAWTALCQLVLSANEFIYIR